MKKVQHLNEENEETSSLMVQNNSVSEKGKSLDDTQESECVNLSIWKVLCFLSNTFYPHCVQKFEMCLLRTMSVFRVFGVHL